MRIDMDKIIKAAVISGLMGVMALAVVAGEDWGNPIYGTFVGSTSITYNQSRMATLKYITLGTANTNGTNNTYTIWLENKAGSLSVSNQIAISDIAADSYTNSRTSLLTEMLSNGDVIHISNTNSTITNKFILSTSTLVR